MTFNDLCDYAARELPPGWEITIRLETKSGSVELDCPDDGEFEPFCHESMEDQVVACVEWAKGVEATS